MTRKADRVEWPWRYRIGVGVALAIGGAIGYGVFLVWGRWHYGPDPIKGFVDSIIAEDGGTNLLAFLLPFILWWVLVSGAGIVAYRVYRRTSGKGCVTRTGAP